MPAGEPARKPPPPPGSPLALLLELEQLEREGVRTPVEMGVFSAYMLSNALKGASQAPGLTQPIIDAGARTIAAVYTAAPEDIRGAYETLDLISATHGGPVDDPGPEYLSLSQDLIQLESVGTGIEFTLGAFTHFHVIGLLQLALRATGALDGGHPRTPLEDIARGLTSSFHGPLAALIERGFHPQHDVDIDGVPAELTLMPVGFGPDAIVDIVEVVTPHCPGCGAEPALILPGAVQAFCPDDDCGVLAWNPQHTADEFWATAVMATESGRLELTDEEVAERAAQLAGEHSKRSVAAVDEPVQEPRDAQQRGDAEHD